MQFGATFVRNYNEPTTSSRFFFFLHCPLFHEFCGDSSLRLSQHALRSSIISNSNGVCRFSCRSSISDYCLVLVLYFDQLDCTKGCKHRLIVDNRCYIPYFFVIDYCRLFDFNFFIIALFILSLHNNDC